MATVSHRTFYDVLGISQDANHDAIKTAYKKMSRQCHPDKNPGNGHAVAWQQAVSSQSSNTADQHIDEMVNSQVNKAYETLRDTTSRITYDAKLPSQRRVLNPFTPQYSWNGFDGAWGMPSSAHWQPRGYSHFGQNTTADDYWGGTQPWHESSTYDFKDSRGEQRQEKDQGWDHNNWHESQPSEPGSFSWTENEESWKQAEEERIKAEKEREERADAERRRRREERRAERHKEQKRRNNARIPEKQKKLLGKIIALDGEIARLKVVSNRSTLTGEAEEWCRTDEEGSDTVDHFSIKLNRRRRVLNEAISIHHNLCRVQRANGQTDEAENAEQELAKAREVSALRWAHELSREDEEQRAGCASLDNPAAFKTLEVDIDEERLRMQQQRHQSNQVKERKLQEQYSRNDAASANRKPNGKRATVEHSDTQLTWSQEGNNHGVSFKLQELAALRGKTDRMQLRYPRIYDWLGQIVDDEENEASGGHTAKNTKPPDTRTRPTKASHLPVDDNSETLIPKQGPYFSPSQGPHHIIDSEAGPLIPDLSPRSLTPQTSHKFSTGEPEPLIPHLDQNASFPPVSLTLADSEPEPLISGLTAEPSEPDTEAVIPNYLQLVHNPHLEVHSEFWDFVAGDGDEVNCDFCGVVLSVLQCPNCNARACPECKTNGGERSYLDRRGWR